MKKIVTCLVILFVGIFAIQSFAQTDADKEKVRKEKWEKFRQDKHNFMTEKMELSEEQAARFFALYDEMSQKKFALNREIRREDRRIETGENITDAEYKAAADKAAALHEKEAAIEKEYYARFCEILSPRQQYLYHRCEVEFQKSMLNKKSAKDKPDNMVKSTKK